MKISLNDVSRVSVVVFAGLFLSACSTVKTASNKPDVILISIDEMSSMEFQEYAHRITGEKKRRMFYETPNLNRLSKEGLSFEEAYSGRLYSSGKAGMLMGRVNGQDSSSDKARSISVAQALPEYESTFIGRWQGEGSPEQVGFCYQASGKAPTDDSVEGITGAALSFIEKNSSNRTRPYFLCLNYSAEQGMKSVDEDGLKYFTKKLSKGCNGMNNPRRAAMVKDLDDGIGEILHKIWRNGLDERTVVIFMPSGSSGNQPEERSGSEQVNACVPLVIRWNEHIKPASWSKVSVDYADILPTIMHCAGYFPEALNADIDGCSLSGLFLDARNQWQSYEREELASHKPGA